MAQEGPRPIVWTFKNTGDLSALQYTFVKLSAAETVVACSSATDKPIGILQNDPTANKVAQVMISGISKVVTGSGGLTFGAQIGTDTSGRAVALVAGTDTTKYVVGTMLDSTGATAGIGTCVIDCSAPNRAA